MKTWAPAALMVNREWMKRSMGPALLQSNAPANWALLQTAVLLFPKAWANHQSDWPLQLLNCAFWVIPDLTFQYSDLVVIAVLPKIPWSLWAGSGLTFCILFVSRRSCQPGLPPPVREPVLHFQHFPQELFLPPWLRVVRALSSQCRRWVASLWSIHSRNWAAYKKRNANWKTAYLQWKFLVTKSAGGSIPTWR